MLHEKGGAPPLKLTPASSQCFTLTIYKLMENQLKDEQIRNQGETIKSLERKVESLERELHKYLDPDSREINPTFKPGKQGEDALLEQIASLQNRPKSKALIRTQEIERTLRLACSSPFMPKWKGIKGNQTFTPKYEQWSALQDNLIESEGLSHYWSHKSFKEVLFAVNYITNKMAIQKPNHQERDKYDEPAEDLGFHFCYCDQTEHEALILLKEIAEKIKESADIYNPNIDDILVSLSLIIQCQAIYLSCQLQEQEEEQEQEEKSQPEEKGSGEV